MELAFRAMETLKLPKTSAIGLNISGFFGCAATLFQVFCGCAAFENICRANSDDAMQNSA
jgi:hypothetical protein